MVNREQTNFQELLVDMLSCLSEREQDVLKQRYHLTSDLEKKLTLRQIGETYNITRERVRQIEREAVNKLVELRKEVEFAEKLKALEESLIVYFERKGGLAREDHFLEEYIKPNHEFDFFRENAFLFVVDNLVDSIDKVEDHDYFYNIWKLSGMNIDSLVSLIVELENILTAENKLYAHEDILGLAQSKIKEELKNQINDFSAKHQDVSDRTMVENYLMATNRLEKNILNQWGMAGWKDISPKKLSDKINLIFLKENKPMHFRDIAERLNGARFSDKEICPATVHNELIANDSFVLVGRGMYAMKDWGYPTGTISDMIEKVLRENNRPMTKDEIFDAISKQRQVNKSTIYLTLINRDQFEKTGIGTFSLKQ